MGADLLEKALLGIAGADAVMQQGMLIGFAQARSAADHQQRRALGRGPRHAKPLQAGLAIGREAGSLLPRHADHVDRGALQPVE